ncbi:hypothetical protein JTB14_002902 [Gonioctena quinquepunctata]|nr:hypothetical protein JTB14_002902 [Gonioctena quinquepunctata]
MVPLHLLWSGLCSFFGYSGFVAFLILKNYPSAVMGIISGTTDGISFFLQYLKRKGTLRLWYDSDDLRKICRLGILVASAGLLNLGYHATIQIMLKTPMLPVQGSEVICIVWSIILLRSGIFLMYHAIAYQKLEDGGLLSEQNDETNNAIPNSQCEVSLRKVFPEHGTDCDKMSILHLIIAGCSFLISVASFIVFTIYDNNFGATFGALAALADGFSLTVIYFYRCDIREEAQNAHSTDLFIKTLSFYGFLMIVVNVVQILFRLTQQIDEEPSIFPISNSNFFDIITCINGLKSGILLVCYCLCYRRRNEEERPLLSPED